MKRYYNTVEKNEVIGIEVNELGFPVDPLPTNVVSLPDTNPFFSILPEGQQLTYDGSNIPDGLEARPPIAYTVEEQAIVDLNNAGVSARSVEAALYLEHRGNSTAINAIDIEVDTVVASSGLSLVQVSVLI